jgi:hypothetical protein
MTRLKKNILMTMTAVLMVFSGREIASLTNMSRFLPTTVVSSSWSSSSEYQFSEQELETMNAANVSNSTMVTRTAIANLHSQDAVNSQCREWRAENWSAFQSSDLWHTHSACCFSKFVLAGSDDCLTTNLAWPAQNLDCQHQKGDAITDANLHLLQSGDSLFVQLHRLHYFVDTILPQLNVSIVLFSTSWTGNIWSTPANVQESQLRDRLAEALVSSDKIAHMFLTNPPYVHPKMSGIPLGLKLKKNWNKRRLQFTQYVDEYWKFLLTVTEADVQKRNGVYMGYLDKTHPTRQGLPNGKKVPFSTYLQHMSEHEYVLSPRGVKPDCYRNWEAIGLGVVPVTNTNRTLHGYTQGAILEANMTEFNATLYPECGVSNCTTHGPIVRDQILLPYWLHHFQCLVQSRYGMRIKYRETAQIAKLLRYLPVVQ